MAGWRLPFGLGMRTIERLRSEMRTTHRLCWLLVIVLLLRPWLMNKCRCEASCALFTVWLQVPEPELRADAVFLVSEGTGQLVCLQTRSS